MTDTKLKIILEALLDKKAKDVVYIDVKEINPFADYFIIATATSQRHGMALANHLKEVMEENDIPTHHIEGRNSTDWVLVDANEYVIHIFSEQARIHFGLEKLWGNLKIVKVV